MPDIKSYLAAQECGDLLTDLSQKPEELEFLGCELGSGQEVFSATYRVSGQQAAIVEDFLHEQYSMEKLRFVCCGWEHGPPGVFRKSEFIGTGHASFQVEMFSDETLVRERDRWQEIPYFYVIAQILSL